MGCGRNRRKLRRIGALGLALLAAAGISSAAGQPPELPAGVRERLARGELEGALTELGALPASLAARPELAYLRARLLERVGRLDEALAALPSTAAELEPLPEPVRAQARALRALWLGRLGRCAEALPQLRELEASGAPEQVLRAAECALATGDAAGALARFERTPTTGRWVDAVAVGLSHAEALVRLGRRAEAAERLRALYIERPEHRASDAVRRALVAAGGEATLELDARLSRAARFMQVRAPARALEELDSAAPPRQRAARARYLHARGMALYGLRTRYAEAARVLAQAAKLGGPDAHEDAFHAARALSRSDQDGRAVTAYRSFARAQRGSARAAEAEYLAAWLELRSGKPRGAREMARLIDSANTPAGRRRTGRFELALHHFDRRRFAEARRLFAEYAAPGGGAMLQGRGLYWAARAAEGQGRRSEAEALYRQVLALEPLHWYALLARERLRALGAKVPGPFADAPPAPAALPELPAAPLPEAARFFAALGLADDARTALEQAEGELLASAPAGRELEALVRAYHALGEHTRPLRRVLRQHPGLLKLRPSAGQRWLWEAAFPRPHAALVETLEREAGLPRGYLHAIMRKESLFDPHVVSYADAIGLMQLLPATARKVGARLGLEVQREALFEPELNLRLSAAFNAELLRTLHGSAVLAIAAYNAGAHRVRPWIAREARNGTLALDRFVERIPIDQTRNYVRRVVTNWARYVYLAGAEPDGWPLELPLELSVPR